MYRDPISTESAASASGATEPRHDESIGQLIGQARQLTAEQVAAVAAYQKQHRMRFGEAAVALGLASQDDVAQALSHQFRYPYAKVGQQAFHADLVSANRPFSPNAEVFRGVRAQLKMRLERPDAPRRAIAILSSAIGDGKSYFAANVAIAFSQLGGRTLLVDANLRHPRQHLLFGIDNATGLSNVLAGRTETHVIHPVAGLPSLFVLPVGAVPPNPLELLEGTGLAALLNEVSGKFDHVVVDTSALAHGMDGAVTADVCGVGLVVVRRARSQLASVQDLVALLSESRAELAGVIMNEF